MGRSGRGPSFEKLMGRAAAHEMWAAYEPLRFAHEAAHVFSWAGLGRGP